MAFRDDHAAARARADALDRELKSVRNELARVQIQHIQMREEALRLRRRLWKTSGHNGSHRPAVIGSIILLVLAFKALAVALGLSAAAQRARSPELVVSPLPTIAPAAWEWPALRSASALPLSSTGRGRTEGPALLPLPAVMGIPFEAPDALDATNLTGVSAVSPTANMRQVRLAISSVQETIRACAPGETGFVDIRLTVGSSGRATAASVLTPAFAGTPEGLCMARAARFARVAPSSDLPFSVMFSVLLGEPSSGPQAR